MNYLDNGCMKTKFSSQADADLLAQVRAIADEEGRQFQAVLHEALTEWVERKRGTAPRAVVLSELKATISRNRELYQHLAQ
jgi:hypothetical protein